MIIRPGVGVVLLDVAVIGCFAYDLRGSLGIPQIGSLGYSLQRMRPGSDAHAVDLWALHKSEWARAGLQPIESVPRSSFSDCKIFVEVLCMMAVGALLMVLVCMPPEWLMTSSEGALLATRLSSPFLQFGFAYSSFAVLVHIASMYCKPPLEFVVEKEGAPRIRSLHAHERRGCIMTA